MPVKSYLNAVRCKVLKYVLLSCHYLLSCFYQEAAGGTVHNKDDGFSRAIPASLIEEVSRSNSFVVPRPIKRSILQNAVTPAGSDPTGVMPSFKSEGTGPATFARYFFAALVSGVALTLIFRKFFTKASSLFLAGS